jgi:putative transcriptional regulator
MWAGGDMSSFTVNIKEMRTRLGWSQEELAREVGVSLSTVQRWEQLGTTPSKLARIQLEKVMRQAGVWKEKRGVKS